MTTTTLGDDEDPNLVNVLPVAEPTPKPLLVLPEDWDFIPSRPPLESVIACPSCDVETFSIELSICSNCGAR